MYCTASSNTSTLCNSSITAGLLPLYTITISDYTVTYISPAITTVTISDYTVTYISPTTTSKCPYDSLLHSVISHVRFR